MILDIIIAGSSFDKPKRSKVVANNSTLNVSNSKILGNNNKITGDNNVIVGNNNKVNGNGNTVTGNNNSLYGDDNSIKSGNNNTIHGNGVKPTPPRSRHLGEALNSQQVDRIHSLIFDGRETTPTEFENAGRKWNLGVIELDEEEYKELEAYMKDYE